MNLQTNQDKLFNFNKSKRLLSSNQFKQVFNCPSKKIHSEHFLLFVSDNKLSYARLGLAITKRKIKTAVHRNIIKRHSRELFRLSWHHLPAVDCVLIVKKSSKDFVNIHSELNGLFMGLSQLSL